MFYIGVLCRRITPKKSSDKPPEVWKHASMLIRRIKVRVIYIDGSPLCQLGMKTLLGGGVITLSSPNMNIIKNISPAPDLIIMEFPQEIYRFEAYLEFIKYSRGEYKGVRLLFFIDKTSPLILAFIAAAQPDAVLHKREALQVVRETCATLARQETSERHVVNRQRAAAITPGEAAVLCETARTEDIRLTARRLNLHPKTVYSHLNNAGKKFGIRNRVELLKMIALL
ncbi:helix-turn-helix domain-containing protein [Serratia marcescens]|uniref:helix-turn-helix domain-containing protein n=1 Tax=Serratia marcescens TaxID=615 RepID=UPI001CBDE53A|nr:LuxR C-terminal-related transcriptional regulator [Serratia marcescens]MDP8630040.1 LuxR C-terminal-related transcriptional regulator [Serratia marcescens]MDP8674609.1 LuxR C-terminal-related transcriptional regulator [Serratia marcescens]MDP8708948.1 LuxR C-terminal-related transcriptional regulator [Serratia marcescens]MDP8748872.1 LuxR C-terminal-related transcriptional regulator [Serratia marcescens]MDP8818538.1 LuxR C-terminal-related transcriptional regulator [Serratia marcescens]